MVASLSDVLCISISDFQPAFNAHVYALNRLINLTEQEERTKKTAAIITKLKVKKRSA